jgi:indolepyruvate ferredoxin oxidoreductase beta subunit
VKKSEVHGMAQRGGSVTSHVRFGAKIFSPIIDPGGADLVVAFEALEALRYAHFTAPGGHLLYDRHRIDPAPVLLGLFERPPEEQVEARLRERVPDCAGIQAFDAARQLGNARVQNVIMLGAASTLLEFPERAYRQAIETMVKGDFVPLNLQAFEVGRKLAAKS